LNNLLDEVLKKSYRRAVLEAARETDLDIDEFRIELPWTYEQIIDDDFLP